MLQMMDGKDFRTKVLITSLAFVAILPVGAFVYLVEIFSMEVGGNYGLGGFLKICCSMRLS